MKDKDQYLRRRKEELDSIRILTGQIQECGKKIKALDEAFVEANREFADGEKILFCPYDAPPHEVFVKYAFVLDDGVIRYRLMKPKKDGTMSSHQDYTVSDYLHDKEWTLKKIAP